MFNQKAVKIKLLILDVDGVMTDGTIWIDDRAREQKGFNVKDGLGMRCLMKNGIDVAVITSRQSEVVARRAGELGLREVHQAVSDKRFTFYQILEKRGLTGDQVCYMGDDLPDLPLLKEVGLSVAVADAAREVRDQADFVTENRGGQGAVREVCELILKAQDKWDGIVSSFVNPG